MAPRRTARLVQEVHTAADVVCRPERQRIKELEGELEKTRIERDAFERVLTNASRHAMESSFHASVD